MKRVQYLSKLVALIFILMLIPVQSVQQATPSRPAPSYPGDMLKVIVPEGALDKATEGLVLWHDYGAFALYRATPAAWQQLTAETRATLTSLPDADDILLQAHPFNTQTENFENIPGALRAPSQTGAALHLIQFVGPIKAQWLDMVRASGAEPVHYLANYGYLVWADAEARATLDALASEGDVMQFSAPYLPYFKLGNPLAAQATSEEDPDATVKVTVQMYALGATKIETERMVAALAAEQHAFWTPVLDYQNTLITVRTGDLAAIAARPDVVWVGAYHEPEQHDEVQNQILAGNLDSDQQAPIAPGYLAWLKDHGISTNPADYPILDITDDGIGNGNLDSGDPTLHSFGNQTNPSRLYYVQSCTNSPNGGSQGGHGHINASIAGGYDERAGFPFRDPNGYQRGQGINPFARLGGTRIFDSWGFNIEGCGNTYPGLIQAIQDAGAQISSNSWGCTWCAFRYDESSQAYDVGVRDADPAEPGNQALTFIFSAGNAGPEPGYVGTPGNAKNVIAVGASENARPSDEDGAWTDGCRVGPLDADHAMDIIYFSSRGPAPGGRIKPDLVAPGTHIHGTASTHPTYTGDSVCDPYRPSGQNTFAASSGTSHAAPAVAGIASLYHHWLVSRYGLTPSPAMLKAYLIAHPTYLTGKDAGGNLPSLTQGYGMPNLGLGLDETGRFLFDQSHVFDNTGEAWVYDLWIQDPNKPVRIVMAYTDKAGAIGYNPRVNDLDLQVVWNDTFYHGNHFDGAWSVPGHQPDANNNVEAVFLPPGRQGSLSLTVLATQVADDGVPNRGDDTDQDFALVAYNVAPRTGVGRLAGTVHVSGSTEPLPNARVTAQGTMPKFATSVYAQEDGTYHMVILSDTYTVNASTYGYSETILEGIRVVSGTTRTLDIPLSPTPLYLLEGYIRDARTGWPLYAQIDIVPEGYPQHSIRRYSNPLTGYYSATLVSEHPNKLTARAWVAGYTTHHQSLVITEATQLDVGLYANTQRCDAPGYCLIEALDQTFDAPLFPPQHWAAFDLDGQGSQWARVIYPTHGASEGAAMHRNGASDDGMQDGWLVTPWLTLPDDEPHLRFWESVDFAIAYHKHSLWLCAENCENPPDHYVEIATFDQPVEDMWMPRDVDLHAYGGQEVRLAFRYQGDFAARWTVDDVHIASACNPPINGGLILGNVYDANTGLALAGAAVHSARGDVFTASQTTDPALDDALYVLSAPAGAQTVTATAPAYTHSIVPDVSVQTARVTWQSLALDAGWPQAKPPFTDVRIYEGESTTTTFMLSNQNPVMAFEYKLFWHEDSISPQKPSSANGVLVVSRYTPQRTAMVEALIQLNIPYESVSEQSFVKMRVAELMAYRAIFYANTPDYAAAGAAHTLLVDYLDNGGALYISDNDLGRHHEDHDPHGLYTEYLKSTFHSENQYPDIVSGEGIMVGLELDISKAWAPDEFSVRDGGQRILRFPNGWAAGVAVDDGYRAIATTFDFDGIVNSAQRTELAKNVLLFLERPTWLSYTPISGTLAPGASQAVTLTLDASTFTQAGAQHGTLHLLNDSPYTMTIPVTMTVLVPETYLGKSAEPLRNVHNGDAITYTLTLSSTATSARLWDPLPANVRYIPGSLTGTINPPATYVSASHAIRWEGEPPNSSLATVQFQVETQAGSSIVVMPPIINTAWLRDTRTGAGQVATVVVNSGQTLFLPLLLRMR